MPPRRGVRSLTGGGYGLVTGLTPMRNRSCTLRLTWGRKLGSSERSLTKKRHLRGGREWTDCQLMLRSPTTSQLGRRNECSMRAIGELREVHPQRSEKTSRSCSTKLRQRSKGRHRKAACHAKGRRAGRTPPPSGTSWRSSALKLVADRVDDLESRQTVDSRAWGNEINGAAAAFGVIAMGVSRHPLTLRSRL